ncbi:MAG: DNA-3-methyladenine glycosylase I [Candidatus Nanopelagicales bacterium]
MAHELVTGGGVVIGEDGIARCPWSTGSADYAAYHDHEWGRPVRGDSAIFERICLEAFQSGLSWLTILRKRPAFRTAFAQFDPREVAQFNSCDVDRLMEDAGIVRNRRKIEATVGNARAVVSLLDGEGDGALDALFWSFAPSPLPRRPRSISDVASATDDSRALSARLKAIGLAWVGPTTMYAAMQACGVVNDHLIGCAAPGD